MPHKEIAKQFLHYASSGRIDEAYELTGEHFIHHNVYYPGDKESLKQGMKESDKQFPNKEFEIKHVVEEGNLVAVHSRVALAPTKVIAVVHLFRFEHNKIVELWGVGQQLPDHPINDQGAF